MEGYFYVSEGDSEGDGEEKVMWVWEYLGINKLVYESEGRYSFVLFFFCVMVGVYFVCWEYERNN